jgi:cyclopropane fatty-acyl-phospholipid synthase-like methyltransferase
MRRLTATGRVIEPSQQASAAALNAEFFAENDTYKLAHKQLELYRLIALAAAHETERSQALLDIGNGGLFEYPIAHIPHVSAIDLFVEKDFGARYPKVEWHQLSVLEMEFSECFDTAIAINTLHHVVGSSVDATYENLREFMARAKTSLKPAGKLIVIESTMPRWFVSLYGLVFPLLLRIWPLSHPPTFQFHFRDILAAGQQAGLELREFTWIPKTSDFLFLGRQIKRWMAPIRVGKFVFTRPA